MLVSLEENTFLFFILNVSFEKRSKSHIYWGVGGMQLSPSNCYIFVMKGCKETAQVNVIKNQEEAFRLTRISLVNATATHIMLTL